jgi:hypothetical protein
VKNKYVYNYFGAGQGRQKGNGAEKGRCRFPAGGRLPGGLRTAAGAPVPPQLPKCEKAVTNCNVFMFIIDKKTGFELFIMLIDFSPGKLL